LSLKETIDKSRLPEHIAIIMDGNGRWAKERNRSRIFGHKNGVKTVKRVVEASSELGVKYLTLYTFSKENWGRPLKEVNALMDLLVITIRNELEELAKNNVQVNIIGEIDMLPPKTVQEIKKAVEITRSNTGLKLIMALNYGSRWDIINSVRNIASQVKDDKINCADIDENTIKENLSTSGFPDPELLIRTSGEFRISNFLLWELAYTEIYVTKKKWPEFSKEDFYEAVLNYQSRERRFGKVSEQL
jgi:undecaprenyl diphosphate synthase